MRSGALGVVLGVLLGCNTAPPSRDESDASVDAKRVDASQQMPDAARSGAVELTIKLHSNRLTEGLPARVVVTLSGAMDTELSVGDLAVEGAVTNVDTLTFQEADRQAVFTLLAPFDADQDDGEARIEVTIPGISRVVLTLPILDVHHTIELGFDREQLEFVGRSNDKERRLLTETVIDGEPGPMAESNLRGKGTLPCPRRSFTTRFETPTRIGGSPVLEHVLLLSMCLDASYLKMRVANELLQKEGLFPPWFSLAELRYGGESRGVYLVVERPRKAVPRVMPQNQLLIRHLSDSVYELKRPKIDTVDDENALLAPYLRLFELRHALSGDALFEALSGAMDYPLYLRWLAVNSLLENGDYIDEVYFYDGAPRPASTPGDGPFFRPLAWDYDDIFKNCHTPRPLSEPLFYCAEGGLDRATRDTPKARIQYVAVLRELMASSFAPSEFAKRVDRVRDEMAIYLDRPGVREVMTREAGPPDVEAGAVEMKSRQAARHAALSTVLEAE